MSSALLEPCERQAMEIQKQELMTKHFRNVLSMLDGIYIFLI